MTSSDPRDPRDPRDPTVVTPQPADSALPGTQTITTQSTDTAVPGTPPIVTQQTTTSTTMRPGGAELGRRVVLLLFGLIQIVIILRVVLLVLDAREGNALVSAILNVSQVFVAPFDGILHTNALQTGGSILDLAAIVALVGWTILELIVLWAIGVFRREPA